MENQWTLLPPVKSSLQSLPQLLIRHSFQSDRYSVSLTDLTRIWSETLGRRDIIKRALNENTSIDPTEDSAQLRVLLDTIKTPLTGENGVLELASSSYHTILLRATARLPPPLNSLSWTYQLTLAPESSIRHDIIAPICVLAYKQEQEIQDLLRCLRDKDHVISKLLDSVESSNTELSTIFPSTAGMKMSRDASRREHAMQHVPGLGAFDEEAWQEEFDQKNSRFTTSPSSIALTEVNAAMFESLCRRSEAVNYGAEWWADLGRLPAEIPQIPDSLPPTSIEEKAPAVEIRQGFRDDDETESEDEYQKQPTPPHLYAQKSVAPDYSAERSRGIPAVQNEMQTEIRPSKSPAKKLGRIGGRSMTPQALLEVSCPHSSAQSTARNSPSEGESTSKGPVRKLGRIGGKTDKTKAADTSSDLYLQNYQSKDTTSKFSTPEMRDPPHPDNSPPSDKTSPAVLENERNDPSPTKEESTEEAANRKRQELRRKLQAQEQASNKKKRRF